ncbi:MAG: hypothetical protein ACI9M9_000859 [Flavobacteriaceae bacterium]|jgi:hypothetical protein
MLTETDLKQISKEGLHPDSVKEQLEIFIHGIPFSEVVTAASIGNGIQLIEKVDQQKMVDLFEQKKGDLDLVKFVPASGAATRMFGFLHRFLDEFDPDKKKLNDYLKNQSDAALANFLKSIKEFAFVDQVRRKIREHYPDYRRGTKGMRAYTFVKMMLTEKGLNFMNMPKGLIPFHKYSKYSTTAFEEQLYESSYYASAKDEAFLHFTFSESDVRFFKNEFEDIKRRVTKKTKTKFNISYSFQKKGTKTIAVSEKNQPARNASGELIFRPSGHGALLENINDIDADIIFIKNIDNVVIEELSENNSFYKKMLAGKLLWIQTKVFGYLQVLAENEFNTEWTKEVKSFLWNELNIKDIPDDIEKIEDILNRPIRICGMVKNTGAAGGGPFWVKDVMDKTTLQIVELAQINLKDARQQKIINQATHFNPVDLVCGVRDYKGKKFDLRRFTDPNTGFITKKSENGVSIKALELPGLWNGGMADWNTVLVEVPLSTFNPVKTVNDLLNREHRSYL